MKIVYFTHSLSSCWNHGNAHFLRGVLRELKALGHEVAVFEPIDAWSRDNLVRDHGEAGLRPFRLHYPELSSHRFAMPFDVEAALDGADLVLVHEWNEPGLVASIGDARRGGGRFRLLFHDTHHRAVSEPQGIEAFDLSAYDGVLAFGETLADVYRRRGWEDRCFVWHEAADTRLFKPPETDEDRDGLIWIGNWGDGERTRELEEFLLAPAREAGLSLDIHGVRYPPDALALLDRYGARYHGWLANAAAPDAFARHMATVHVPRRFYVEALPGIPTIRIFEALACGIPLVSAPWRDSEHLFTPGSDFLMVSSGEAMTAALRDLQSDAGLRAELARQGLSTIRARHTCAHRATELLAIARGLGASLPGDHAS
ncbi:glycosyltransferase [Aureimonas sp. Leaf454]|uniref:CgeB family protein n=1 Tax=Aureimonas sp. Leaf454 TaxID=1736381 RepID=UPI0006FF6310|nr:glycosyltransferase [Aureimonas sp. Leaf454]KQT53774.1 glycosyltransferase [Aureimonas sp. Leaf454]